MIRNNWLLQPSQRSLRRPGRCHVRRISALTRRRIKLSLETLEDRNLLSATITDLGVLPGDTYSSATAINGSGQVVGISENFSNGSPINDHAFLYSNGQMIDLGTLPGADTSDALGINDSGQVVGYSGSDAFLYSNGKMSDLGTLPPGIGSQAYGINDSGQVVGNSWTYGFEDTATPHAFLYSNGQMNDLGTLPGGYQSYATAINDSGQVVGYSQGNDSDGGFTDDAFLCSNGQMTDLGTLPGVGNGNTSYATAINGSGQVVGYASSTISSGPRHAFLYSNGQMTDLGTLPGDQEIDEESFAYGINSSGQVVGDSETNNGVDPLSGVVHAFLYSNGQMIDLNTLLPANSGWELTHAQAINDSGQIVGDGTINGQEHAFLLNLNLVSLSPASLPSGVVNTAYTQTISARGGTGDKAVTYTVTSGAIPAGLIFATKTNELDITGTPTTAGSVTFKVAATDSGSPPSDTTQTYTLTVSAAKAPSITANPTNQTVAAGQTATFTASANGTPTLTVQWKVSTDGSKSFIPLNDGANVSGATSTTLMLSNVTTAMSGYEYEAVFSNSAGSSNTNAATLTVSPSLPPPPPPVSQPPSPPAPSEPPALNVPPLLALFDSLLGGTETVNGNGTETITDSFFGIPLLVSTFDRSGELESVLMFGIDVTGLFELF